MWDLFEHLLRVVCPTAARGRTPRATHRLMSRRRPWGTSAFAGIENGKLDLGTWQGIFLCEFDGPRNRTVKLRILA